MTADATIIDDPDLIQLYSMRALIGALSLERHGMRRRGPSALTIAKRNYPVKGNRERVYTQMCELYEKEKARLGVAS